MATEGAATHWPHVLIVGAGVAGLSAAFALRDAPVRVTVLEAEDRLGGALSMSEVAGTVIDVGAEGLYARRPRTRELIEAVGLGARLTPVTVQKMAIWSAGRLRPLPDRQFMGVPADLDELDASGLISREGIARARQDLHLPRLELSGDVSVAHYVSSRLGREVLDRLVEPFFGDVCAGDCEKLSFEAMLTPLARASKRCDALTAAAASLLPSAPAEGDSPPGLATLLPGLGTLPGAIVRAIVDDSPHTTIRTRSKAVELTHTSEGWLVTITEPSNGERFHADGVILATPAFSTAELVSRLPGGGRDLADDLLAIPYEDTAIVTLAFPRGGLPGERLRGLAGYRVPSVENKMLKVVTFSSAKWPHLSDFDFVRGQLGGTGPRTKLDREDRDIVDSAVEEVSTALQTPLKPVVSKVNRWPASLPQYVVGHLERVERIRTTLRRDWPELMVCGSAFDGVGVGNCIASGIAAGEELQERLFRPVPPATAVRAGSNVTRTWLRNVPSGAEPTAPAQAPRRRT